MSTPKEMVMASMTSALRMKIADWEAELSPLLKQQHSYVDRSARIDELTAFILEARKELAAVDARAKA